MFPSILSFVKLFCKTIVSNFLKNGSDCICFWIRMNFRATFYKNQAEFETCDNDHLRFCHLSFILFLLYLLLNCEKFIRQNPVVPELQPLTFLLPGGKIFKIDFFSYLNIPTFSCKHWLIGVIGSCKYMASLLT